MPTAWPARLTVAEALLRLSAPSLVAEMALPLFCERLSDNFVFETLVGTHFLQAAVLVFELLHAGHQGCIHAAEFGAPLVERSIADAVFAAKLRNRAAGFVLLQDGDDLAVGKA